MGRGWLGSIRVWQGWWWLWVAWWIPTLKESKGDTGGDRFQEKAAQSKTSKGTQIFAAQDTSAWTNSSFFTQTEKKEPKLRRGEEWTSESEKPRKNDKQCTKDTEQAEQAPAMIYEKDMPKIQKYVDAYKDDSATEATQEMRDGMRAKLKASNLQECRLNIYWRTKAVGCTSRSLGKDIAYFNFNDVEGLNYMSKLAAALRCAKLFVTWVHIDANRMYMCMHQVGGIHETPCILTGETQAFHKYLYIICMELFMRIAVCLFTGYPHTRPRWRIFNANFVTVNPKNMVHPDAQPRRYTLTKLLEQVRLTKNVLRDIPKCRRSKGQWGQLVGPFSLKLEILLAFAMMCQWLARCWLCVSFRGATLNQVAL